ncbi:hypothetical protein H5410_001631 [Solanum commersonii]|uniref:Uncharacterized protein n=1 Tax=Solanum commersonii TaxID=4109 RepID=A0A9J6B050_SOLCO|nr:hypothetical protein H5410_001631 [Solanum commersonii]
MTLFSRYTYSEKTFFVILILFHKFLGEIESDFDFTTQCVPIIVGGSNSYIEKLVEDPVFMFKYKYDSCFIWIDVEQSVFDRRVDTRVDEMVNAGSFCSYFINE